MLVGCHTALRTTGRAWRCWEIEFRLPGTAANSKYEVEVKYKKPIDIRLPKLKLNRITNAHCYSVYPTCTKTQCYAQGFIVVFVFTCLK